jgi:hypothetical protein
MREAVLRKLRGSYEEPFDRRLSFPPRRLLSSPGRVPNGSCAFVRNCGNLLPRLLVRVLHFWDYMLPTAGLLLLLPLLLWAVPSCSMGLPSERKPVEFELSDGSKIICYQPPPDVIATGGKAYAEVTAIRLGTILQATGGAGLDIERIRQELPPEVSSFEVVEFRICVQYGNRVLSKQAYQAFTEKILPAYTKNPPAKIVYTAGTPASAQLVEACGPSFTTKRPAAKFVSYWAAIVNRLRQERNVQYHDLRNLMQVRGRTPVEEFGINPFEEVNFTLDCQERIGYLKTEKIDPPDTIGATLVANRRIIFLQPSLTIP